MIFAGRQVVVNFCVLQRVAGTASLNSLKREQGIILMFQEIFIEIRHRGTVSFFLLPHMPEHKELRFALRAMRLHHARCASPVGEAALEGRVRWQN